MSDTGKRAQMLYDARLYRQADALVREAIAEDPENADNFCTLAALDGMLGRRVQSIESARQAVSLDPEYYYGYICLANALSTNYKYSEAMDAAQMVLKLNPSYAHGYGVAGRTACALKDFASALQYAERGLAINAISDSCLDCKAVALRGLGRASEAEAIEQSRLQDDPGNAWHHLARGYGARDSDQQELMLEHFQNALKLNPDNEYTHFAIATAYLGKGDLALAEKHSRIAYDMDPQDVSAAILLSEILCRLNKLDDAMAVIKPAYKLYPDSGRLLLKITEIALAVGDIKLAEQAANNLICIKSNVYSAIHTFMCLQKHTKKTYAIDQMVEDFVRENPQTQESFSLLIMQAQFKKNNAAVERIATEALINFPDDDHFKEQLVYAQMLLKKYEAAYNTAQSLSASVHLFKKTQILTIIDCSQNLFDQAMDRMAESSRADPASNSYGEYIKVLVAQKWLRADGLQRRFYDGVVKARQKWNASPRDPIPKFFCFCDCFLLFAVAGNLLLLCNLLVAPLLRLDPHSRRFFNHKDTKKFTVSLVILAIEGALIFFYKDIWALLCSVNFWVTIHVAFLIFLACLFFSIAPKKRYVATSIVVGTILFAVLLYDILGWLFPRH